ncbi:hypothetical protein EHI8A_042060 [Entamoeba histolytica HM-1:IMSS-B]|uniref:UPF3 domain-containing protein n=6 Tax=Entamoeba histolytica TaxID=5759 RepID=B1N4T0_ENTH1|nr:hypothetical protein EHI_196520 [Entamoeba histolytica HM-1:IMSS]EMD48161.1 Hypothetical protein EHI5A_074410 [Entamoeba histolytica KU27]EMH78069.1 hypothetical protein EHI8A_042060 [Entamoeba histolytica HM-1:IMSS-B]EMS12701.1 hypothetical protein KM1_086980 [Entamoeba histolytica HM-3:IMSS]ENY60021.1 hypothetical protein EHI7A_105380 [Entamoeba histolytica HM-1:IMSS-A]GAT98816.1 hypothetical protein CL6EHI_196520 [Entamoeba histolytica]|eukprot:XP_001914196.1 hypothetical protein EHI_196520 [Entamoeba histolytica HM-1:IMSS]
MAVQQSLKLIVQNIPTSNGRIIADKLYEEFSNSIDYYNFIAPENSIFCSAIFHFIDQNSFDKFCRKYTQHTYYLPNGQQKELDIKRCINSKLPADDVSDELNGTLEDDPIYQQFADSLSKRNR